MGICREWECRLFAIKSSPTPKLRWPWLALSAANFFRSGQALILQDWCRLEEARLLSCSRKRKRSAWSWATGAVWLTARGYTRRAAIRPNKHQRIGDRSISAREYEDRSSDAPCYGPTSWIYSHTVSQNGQTRKFSACRALKKAAGQPILSGNATANTENGNCPADGVGLLGRIAACLVQLLLRELGLLALKQRDSQNGEGKADRRA
jgi:hypothetical protein